MSQRLDRQIRTSGTKFRIYPQPRTLPSFQKPEVVTVSVPPHEIAAGPADARMYVADAVRKRAYGPRTAPPYTGPVHPPVTASRSGHFTHLKPETREFAAAAMYATVRRVLDIWEDYLGGPLDWIFTSEGGPPRLELLPLIRFDNAQAGFGFLEFGFARRPQLARLRDAYCLNFDVLAHEFGHCMIDCVMGYPKNERSTTVDYYAFHEGMADMVSIISVLHFPSVVDHLLRSTHGNLFSVNELARVGELSRSNEIRRAFNSKKMSDVDVEPHDRSEPLAGAMFDVLVEIFQKELVRKKLISADLAKRSTQGDGAALDDPAFPKEFRAAYRGRHADFTQALLNARDVVGTLLAHVMLTLPADRLTFDSVYRAMLDADRSITKARHQRTITECFEWREIGTMPIAPSRRIHSLRHCQR